MNEMYEIDIKRNIVLVVISVIILTIVTLSVSYSAFFSVRSQSTVQQLKAGVLDVTIDYSAYIEEDLFPTATSELPTLSNSTEDTSQLHSTITLENEGTIEAEYSITITADTPNGETAIDFQYINVGIIDDDLGTWHNFGTNESPVYYTALTTLGTNDSFPVLRDTISATDTKQYRIYIWLAEETPDTEIGNYVYLRLNVKSMTVNGRIGS